MSRSLRSARAFPLSLALLLFSALIPVRASLPIAGEPLPSEGEEYSQLNNLKEINGHILPTLLNRSTEKSETATDSVRTITYFKLLVVLVQFPDEDPVRRGSEESAEHIENLFFDMTPGAASLHNYFQEASEGLFFRVVGIEGDRPTDFPPDEQWITLPRTAGWYYYNGGAGGYVPEGGREYCNPINQPCGNSQNLVEDLLPLIRDRYPDLSPYDNDGDGLVDGLVVVLAGQEKTNIQSADHFRSHTWSLRRPIDVGGTDIYAYSIVTECLTKTSSVCDQEATLGRYAHEFGHILGLPELYDKRIQSGDDGPYGAGRWSVMGTGALNGPTGQGENPAPLGVWEKVQLGLADLMYVVGLNQNTPIHSSAFTGAAFHLPTEGNEYFLLENRYGTHGFFETQSPAEGLLIWHVDQNAPENGDGEHYQVALEQADGLFHLDNEWETTYDLEYPLHPEEDDFSGDHGDPFPGLYSNYSFFTDTVPSSDLYETDDQGNPLSSGVGVFITSEAQLIMRADLVAPHKALVSPQHQDVVKNTLVAKIVTSTVGEFFTAQLIGKLSGQTVILGGGESFGAASNCAQVLNCGGLVEIPIETKAQDTLLIDNGPAILRVTGNDWEKEIEVQIANTVSFTVDLNANFTFASWPVDPVFSHMRTIFAPISDCIQQIETLGYNYKNKKVARVYSHKDPMVLNTLRFFDSELSYFIRTKDECSNLSLTIEGVRVPPDRPIQLTEGWNMVPYYPEEEMPLPNPPPDGFDDPYASVISSVWDVLDTILGWHDGHGIYHPQNTSFSYLWSLHPGRGYCFHVAKDATLRYNVSGAPQVGATSNLTTAPETKIFELTAQTVFITSTDADGDDNPTPPDGPEVQPTDRWFFIGSTNLTLNGNNVLAGTTITAHRNSDDLLVGSFTLEYNGVFGYMPVYGASSGTDGMGTGQSFYLKVGATKTQELFTWQQNEILITETLSTPTGGPTQPCNPKDKLCVCAAAISAAF